MGRTIIPFRQLAVHRLEESKKFGRALRREDRIAFEQMLCDARKHMHACSYSEFLEPVNALLLSMLIEQGKKLRELNERLASGSVWDGKGQGKR